MKRTLVILAAFALMASAGLRVGPAFAGKDNGDKAPDASATATAEEASQDDDALKVLEQGFSIPAADGTASKDEKKGTTRK